MAKSSYSGEEVAALGCAAAWRVLATFEEQRLVPAFVEHYVRQHSRRELKAAPLRYRELLITITRESLVAIAARMQAELPRKLGGAKAAAGDYAEAVDAFLQALAGALASALHWTPGDVAEFASDVALYARMAAFSAPRAPAAAGKRRGKAAKPASAGFRSQLAPRASGPFADRCALLLDPSLMEKARAAAGELHHALEKIADDALAKASKAK
jgi:hypothetical protein